jgi:hypothetical protein
MNDTTTALHPFERSGNGLGPFRFAGSISLPPTSMGEQNTAAFNSKMAEAQAMARKAGVRLGACDHCGTGIMHHAVIRDSTGKSFVVGFDCVRKTNDASLADRAEVSHQIRIRALRRELAQSKREAKRSAWLAEIDTKTGESNADRIARESQEREAALRNRLAEEKARQSLWQFWVDACGTVRGNFVASVIQELNGRGRAPTGRGLDICAEIFGKQSGRAGSKENAEAQATFWKKLQT